MFLLKDQNTATKYCSPDGFILTAKDFKWRSPILLCQFTKLENNFVDFPVVTVFWSLEEQAITDLYYNWKNNFSPSLFQISVLHS